jgi:hypothetical protein
MCALRSGAETLRYFASGTAMVGIYVWRSDCSILCGGEVAAPGRVKAISLVLAVRGFPPSGERLGKRPARFRFLFISGSVRFALVARRPVQYPPPTVTVAADVAVGDRASAGVHRRACPRRWALTS